MNDASSINALMTFGTPPQLAGLWVNGIAQPGTLAPLSIRLDVLTANTVVATVNTFTSISTGAITGIDGSLGITGRAGVEGGAVAITGGKASTSANAGGAVTIAGGLGGATGAGGAVAFAGGAGTATAAGGVASLTGGASGAGATGNGATASLVGGAALSTNGSGGNAVVTGGASTGTGGGSSVLLTPGAVVSGAAGGVLNRGVVLDKGAISAKTTSATLTISDLTGSIITVTQGAGAASNLTLPLAADMDSGLPPDRATGDILTFSVTNTSTVTAEAAEIKINTGWTLAGNMTVPANDGTNAVSSGTFRAIRTGTTAYTLVRV